MYRLVVEARGSHLMPKPEQKSVEWRKVSIAKLSEHLGVDFRGGIAAVAKHCLLCQSFRVLQGPKRMEVDTREPYQA